MAEESLKEVRRIALGRKEAAAAINVSVETLARLAKRGLIHPSRATRRPLFSVVELERFLRDTATDTKL
jgi:DNA-binding transcriptional MerR regulator